MDHLTSDYEAITKAIRESAFDSEDALRRAFLEVIDFQMAFRIELQKSDRKLTNLEELVAEMGEDLDTVMGDSPDYLSLELGSRVVALLHKGMEISASLVKALEEAGMNDIRKQQVHAVVEPYLQATITMLAELDGIIDKEEDDDGDDGDDPGDSDGDSGADGDGDAEEEGEAAEES